MVTDINIPLMTTLCFELMDATAREQRITQAYDATLLAMHDRDDDLLNGPAKIWSDALEEAAKQRGEIEAEIRILSSQHDTNPHHVDPSELVRAMRNLIDAGTTASMVDILEDNDGLREDGCTLKGPLGAAFKAMKAVLTDATLRVERITDEAHIIDDIILNGPKGVRLVVDNA